jgi:hypothetical protein
MKKAIWKSMEGNVDASSEHLELRYGDAATADYESWRPVALIGKPEGNSFPVTWLLNPETPEEHEMIKDARGELDFYLVKLGYDDPWAYACYHCRTASNVYSSVHWSYFPHGRGDSFAISVLRDKQKGHVLFISNRMSVTVTPQTAKVRESSAQCCLVESILFARNRDQIEAGMGYNDRDDRG